MFRHIVCLRLLAIVVSLVCFASVAEAFDVDGAWRGIMRCQEWTPDARKRRFSIKGLLRISHEGGAIGMRLHTDQFVRDYAGMTVFDVRRPRSHGEAAFAACGTDDAPAEPSRGEFGRLRVLADRVRGRGILRGETIYTVDSDTIGKCRWVFKWETSIDPGVPLDCS